jgi:hypothetical protein
MNTARDVPKLLKKMFVHARVEKLLLVRHVRYHEAAEGKGVAAIKNQFTEGW